jgi:hypothetical protein
MKIGLYRDGVNRYVPVLGFTRSVHLLAPTGEVDEIEMGHLYVVPVAIQ